MVVVADAEKSIGRELRYTKTWLSERYLVFEPLGLLQLSAAVAPTNSQHIAWRLPGSGPSWTSASFDIEDHKFEDTMTAYPSLPSTARLSRAEAERAKKDVGWLDLEVYDLGPPPV